MKKGKTLMILTIVMLVLLAGSIVNSDSGWPKITKNEDGTVTVTYENDKSIKISSGRFNAVEEILTKLEDPKFFLVEEDNTLKGNTLKFDAKNPNAESDKELAEYYVAEITFDEKDKIELQTYYENYIEYPEGKIRITQINQMGMGEAWIEIGEKKAYDLDEETIKPPTGIPLKKYMEDAAGNQFQLESLSPEARDNFNAELKIIEIFNNQIKVEDNKVIYTAVNKDKKDIDLAKTYNAIIIFDKEGNIESKTYTKKYSDGRVRKTITIPRTETTTSWVDGIVDYIKVGTKKIDINEELSISTVSFKDGILTAELKDGSKGKLEEDGNKFIYDTDEGVIRTLEALEGGGTLEFYNKNKEEGDEGTITITRGNEKITFYGTFDGKEVKEKGEKVLAIDDNGNILTDYKGGKAQTTYYAYKVFSAYVFGRKQSDDSEKIYWPGYVPFAFRTSNGEVIITRKQDDGSYKYFLAEEQDDGSYKYSIDENGKRKELKEGDTNFKEVNAMVRKTKIGPAFYAAARAARGGRALSNLLNSWLDIDFITNWRKKSDEFFSETVIGRIISGKWEESVCHYNIEKIPDSIAVVNVNNVIGFAAHVVGERTSAITMHNETLYFYKITFGVNPYGMGDITFELLIDGNVVDIDNDGMADRIELEADETYSGTGENAVVRYKPEIYEEVCLKFYNTENLNAEFRNALKNNKLCNRIVEVDLSSAEISEPESSTTVSSTSTGQQGW